MLADLLSMKTKSNSNNKMDYSLLQQKTRCNWCRNPMVMSEPVTDANLVDCGYIWNGTPVKSLYCSECLAKEERVKQPKLAMNLDTLEEVDIRILEETQAKEKEREKEGDESLTVPDAREEEEDLGVSL